MERQQRTESKVFWGEKSMKLAAEKGNLNGKCWLTNVVSDP